MPGAKAPRRGFILEGLVDLAVHGRTLMRVLAVAQRLHALEGVRDEHGHARGLALLGNLHHAVLTGLVAQRLQERSIRGVQVCFCGVIQRLAHILKTQSSANQPAIARS